MAVVDFRYPQLCAVARAAEIVGERWSLLILRELFLGPKRFSDIKAHLGKVSTSVLSERLAYLERRGVISRRELEPPAASVVYELTDDGRALEPTMIELGRWGARYMGPPEPGDHFEPQWLLAAARTFARKSGAPSVALELRIPDGERQVRIFLSGNRRGTRVSSDPAAVDAVVEAEGPIVLALVAGKLALDDAVAGKLARVDGDIAKARLLPELFLDGPATPAAP